MGKGYKWPTIVDPSISVDLFALMLTTYGQLMPELLSFLALFALNQLQNHIYSDDRFLGRTSYIDIWQPFFRESSLWEHSAKQDPARIVSHAPRVLNLLIICILEIFRNGGQLLLKTKKNNIQGLVKIVLEMNLTIFWNEFTCKQV